MEHQSRSGGVSSHDDDVISIEEWIKVTVKGISDLDKLRHEYNGYMPEIAKGEYDNMKKRLQKLQKLHTSLISSTFTPNDSIVSPKLTITEGSEFSNRESATMLPYQPSNSMTDVNRRHMSSSCFRPITPINNSQNKTSNSFDTAPINSNCKLKYQNSTQTSKNIKNDIFDSSLSSRKNTLTTEDNIEYKFNSMNLSTREFVVIQIPPKLTYKLRVNMHEDLRTLLSPYFRNLNINVDDIVVADVANKKIVDLDLPSISYSKNILKMYYKSLTDKVMTSFHVLSKKFFVATRNCAICKSIIINGLKCSQCDLTFHKKCYCRKPTLCDPDVASLVSETINSFFKLKTHKNPVLHEQNNNINHSILSNKNDTSHLYNVNMIKTSFDQSITTNQHNNMINSSVKYSTLKNKKWNFKMNEKSTNNDNKVIYKRTSDFATHSTTNFNKIDPYNPRNILPNQTSNNNHSEYMNDINDSYYDEHDDTTHFSNDEKSSYDRRRRRVVRLKPVTDNLSLPWYIDYREVEIECKIGVGSFGTVYKGYWHGSVAVKFLNVISPNEEHLTTFKNEVAILRKTRHNNILLFVGCVYKPRLAIVTQWCDGSSLYNFIHVNEQQFKLTQLVNVALQTCDGMGYLHAKNIIHRDLKSNNLFLQNSVVKIGDFGLSTVKRRGFCDSAAKQPTGSILWMAPEVIRMRDSDPYTVYSDVYSFGIVLYELLSSKLPYSHIKFKDQILYLVGKGKLQPDFSLIEPKYDKTLKNIYLDCIKFQPSDRPLFPNIASKLKFYKDRLPKITRTTSTKDFRTSTDSNKYNFDGANFM